MQSNSKVIPVSAYYMGLSIIAGLAIGFAAMLASNNQSTSVSSQTSSGSVSVDTSSQNQSDAQASTGGAAALGSSAIGPQSGAAGGSSLQNSGSIDSIIGNAEIKTK